MKPLFGIDWNGDGKLDGDDAFMDIMIMQNDMEREAREKALDGFDDEMDELDDLESVSEEDF